MAVGHVTPLFLHALSFHLGFLPNPRGTLPPLLPSLFFLHKKRGRALMPHITRPCCFSLTSGPAQDHVGSPLPFPKPNSRPAQPPIPKPSESREKLALAGRTLSRSTSPPFPRLLPPLLTPAPSRHHPTPPQRQQVHLHWPPPPHASPCHWPRPPPVAPDSAIKSPPLSLLSLTETSHSTPLSYHLLPGALQHLLWPLLAGESSSTIVTVRDGEQMEPSPDDGLLPPLFHLTRHHLPP
jgi:hypothetical protein